MFNYGRHLDKIQNYVFPKLMCMMFFFVFFLTFEVKELIYVVYDFET